MKNSQIEIKVHIVTKQQAIQDTIGHKRSPIEWLRLLAFLITLVVLIITALIFFYNLRILKNSANFSSLLSYILPVGIAVATIILAVLSIAFSRTSRGLTTTEKPTTSSLRSSPGPKSNLVAASPPSPALDLPKSIPSSFSPEFEHVLTTTATDSSIRNMGHLFEQLDAVFQFNQRLTDPRQFIGREAEYIKLVSRTKKKAPTSIVGPTRIGKTWLITYLLLKANHDFGPHFCLGYFDASLPSCTTIAGFTNNALEALRYPDIPFSTGKDPLGPLEAAIKDFTKRQPDPITPVLCIDEFGALESKNGFSLEFFTHLRSLMSLGLVIITASRHPLIETVDEPSKTSPFFNSFLQITLKPFTRREAEAFVQAKGDQAKLTATERQHLLEYGKEDDEEQWNILRLQQFGKLLLLNKYLSEFDMSQTPPYRPNDSAYWHEFKEELEEQFQAFTA